MVVKRAPKRAAQKKSGALLLLIGLFKLVKAVALLLVGFGLLRLINRDIAQTVEHWVRVVRVDPDNRYVHGLLVRVLNVTPRQLREISAGTFIYSALLFIEGAGLLARKHWAEYFTVISTAMLIPLEIYELAHHGTPAKLIVLLVNLLIVVYLAMRLKRG